MSDILIGVIVLGVVFGGALFGMFLRRVVLSENSIRPDSHHKAESSHY
jgi:hypothetical protein